MKILRKNNKSGFRGVFYDNQHKAWSCKITYNQKTIRLGLFSDPVLAAKVYDEARKILYKKWDLCNFPYEQNEDLKRKVLNTLEKKLKRPQIPVNSTSGYLGVNWWKKTGVWRVRIKYRKKSIFLGYYTNKITAACVYDEAARILYGEKTALNFPNERNMLVYEDVQNIIQKRLSVL